MTVTVKLSGFKELHSALNKLPRAAAKTTATRALTRAAQPLADRAAALAPVETGELKSSIIVSTKLVNQLGKKEFHEVMKSGGTKKEAGAAMRAARAGQEGQWLSVVYMGPSKAKSKKDGIKRMAQEFGTVNHAPQPYMRPAWEAGKSQALEDIKRELAREIMATARRVIASKRASYTDAVKYNASIAAMLAHEVG
jgi:HK97 gp10 family phage protein